MKSSARHVKLASVDELFTSDTEREKVEQIPLTDLHPFVNHPFRVVNDDKMQDTAESIREYGVLVPAIARPREDGGYELVSGHRRDFACQLLGLETMPVIVRDLDDDAATIIMVDSNIQRETLLPSERAYALKMKLDAIKRQGSRSDLTSVQNAQKLSAEKVADEAGMSRDQVRRFIRLTELIPELMTKVDNKEIGVTPAVELSYLTQEEQVLLLDAMESEQAVPSHSQALRLKKFSQEGALSIDVMRAIMSEEKKVDTDKVVIPIKEAARFCPKGYDSQQITDYIMRVLERVWRQKQRQAQQTR